jgi:hypothetical protein
MAHDKIYVDDVGHNLTIKTEIDLTNVNSLSLEILRGDESTLSVVMSASTPTSGIATYITQSGDFSVAGVYEGQAKLWTSATNIFHGETFNFQVFSKYTSSF